MTPQEIAKYYISPLDPFKYPDNSGLTQKDIKEHTDSLEDAISNLCFKFNKKQLLKFAEWMEYHSKNKLPEQCVKEFLKSLKSSD